MSEHSKIGKIDIRWIFTLFGTAIGAGLLYLPVQAGQSGFWALLTVLILAFPLTYFSHKNMSNIVINSTYGNITDVFANSLGQFFGLICVILYFFAIFLNMPMYSIGLNNELSNFILQYNFTDINLSENIWFSFTILVVLFAIVSFGINIILRFMQFIVISLIIMVVALSIYIIPFWNGQFVSSAHFDIYTYIKGVLMVLPILILSMNHSPVISSLVVFYREKFDLSPIDKESKIYQIIRVNSLVLFVFVLFFVTSCLLSVTPNEIAKAANNNLSIVTLIKNHHNNIFINIIAPMIVFTSIISSFIGCYIGSREALKYLFNLILNNVFKLNIKTKIINYLCIILMFIILWICTICNFKILNIIGILVAPTVAFLLYILPVIIIYKNIKYKQYRSAFLNITLLVFGFIIVFGYLIGEFAF
jgi:amino acid permease